MSLLTMMITLENAIQKSMTRSSLSVHHTSFLWALCQEFVRSTTHLKPFVSGALLPFSEITPTKPLSSRSRRVSFES
jgi:hypothetical protein